MSLPQIKARAKRLPPEQRRAQLLAYALGVFARRGIGGAHHAEVAAAAGVSVATTFTYFATRDELVWAVLDEVGALYVGLAERIHAGTGSAPELLLAHAREFADSVDSHPDHARIWLNWSGALREEIWPRYLAVEERTIAPMIRTLRRGQAEGSIATATAPEDSARIAIGAAYQIVQMKVLGRSDAEIERFLAALTRALGAVA